jgi:NAD(P)-dependent dehydrogenase (short-subunit alcohol dehydrogenase family)
MVSPIEYSAIKSGIIAITRYLAKYYKGTNIRVNCISPGGIIDNQPEIFLKRYLKSCTHKGMLNASDLSGTLIYLLSDFSKYVNGQNIIVDDGWTL